jgi:hypothetical protein
MRVRGSCSDGPLLPGQKVGRVLRVDGSCVHELCVDKVRIVFPYEVMDWTFDEWKEEWAIESTSSVRFRIDSGFDLVDFGMDRPPTRWRDAPSCESDAWSVFLPDWSMFEEESVRIYQSAAGNGSESVKLRASIRVDAPAHVPLLLLVSRWDRRLPSVVSAGARSSGCGLQCRIIHLDGSGVFAPFGCSEDCEAIMFDVNESGSGPATRAEDATRNKKAIEIFGFVDSSRVVDLDVFGICPPGVSCARESHMRTTFSATNERACSMLAETMDFELRRAGASAWRGIPIPSHIFSKLLSGSSMTVWIEKAHADEPGDDVIVLSSASMPPIRISRKKSRLDCVDVEFGKSVGVQSNKMRILSRGTAQQMHKNTNIELHYRPCVLSFTDSNKRAQGVGLLPPAYSIALHSHGPISCKTTLPRACDVRCAAEDGAWEAEPSVALVLTKDPELRRKVLHPSEWRAFSVRIAEAPVDAMMIINKSHGFPTEAFLPIDVCSNKKEEQVQETKRRRVEEL